MKSATKMATREMTTALVVDSPTPLAPPLVVKPHAQLICDHHTPGQSTVASCVANAVNVMVNAGHCVAVAPNSCHAELAAPMQPTHHRHNGAKHPGFRHAGEYVVVCECSASRINDDVGRYVVDKVCQPH